MRTERDTLGEVRVPDPGFGCRLVLGRRLQSIDRESQPALHRADRGSRLVGLRQRRVHRQDRRVGARLGADVDQSHRVEQVRLIGRTGCQRPDIHRSPDKGHRIVRHELDRAAVHVAAGNRLIDEKGLGSVATFVKGDAFDREALAAIEPQRDRPGGARRLQR